MARASSNNASGSEATRLERRTLGVLGAFMPRSVRCRQLRDWRDFLEDTRNEGGSVRRELAQFASATPVIAWRAGPPLLRIALPPLALSLAAALLLWPSQLPDPNGGASLTFATLEHVSFGQYLGRIKLSTARYPPAQLERAEH